MPQMCFKGKRIRVCPEFTVVVDIRKLAEHIETVYLMEDVGERHVGLFVGFKVIRDVVAGWPGPEF